MTQNIKFEILSTEHLESLAVYLPKVAEESGFLTMEKTLFSVESIKKYIFIKSIFNNNRGTL
jgi:hypothetical protein